MTELSKGGSIVRQGLDLRKFRDFCTFAEQNPADVMFELEATGVAKGRAVHTLATTGAYTLGGQRIDRIARRYSYHFGAHREVEEALGLVDPTDREEVVEVALAALSALHQRGGIRQRCSAGYRSRGAEYRCPYLVGSFYVPPPQGCGGGR